MSELQLSYRPIGQASRAEITVKVDGDTVEVDTVNLASAKQRDRFIASVLQAQRGIDRGELEQRLLGIHEDLQSERAPSDGLAIEPTRIVRPELFYTADVSGLTVPVIRHIDGELAGRWALCLCWHSDGRREHRELSPVIQLPGGEQLCIHPIPGNPPVSMTSAWSMQAQREWLAGEPAPEPESLFHRVCERLAWYLDFGPETAAGNTAVLAAWVIFTYVYPAWSAVPYLSLGGPLGSGKTRVFELLARLVFRPIQSSNMTAPCLFRSLHEHGGVLLLDEAERLRDAKPEAGELRSILLSGYKRGSPARRLEKIGDRFQQVAYDVFGPKAVASIAQLPEALASRCIRLTMFRAEPESEKPRRRIDEAPGIWAGLRNDLHALALEHGPLWLELAGRTDVCPPMSGRDFELWQPLLALASWLEEAGATGLLGIMQDQAADSIELSRDDAMPEADEVLLRLVTDAVVRGTHTATQAKDVLARARDLDLETFRSYTAKRVANALKRYEIRTHKSPGGRRVYGKVTMAQLRRVERNYGFELGLPSDDVPYVPHVPSKGVLASDQAKSERRLKSVAQGGRKT